MASLEPKKEFKSEIKKVETTDLAHANLLNEINQTLINNDAYIKVHLDSADNHIQDTTIHVTFQEKQNWENKAETTIATPSDNGLLSAADKQKLDNIQERAEVNQNAISSVNVDGTVIQSNSKTSQIVLKAGDNVIITGDNGTKIITISANRDGGDAATLGGLTKVQVIQQGSKHLAGQGAGGGYSFLGDGAEDTGMFSDGDGDLYLMRNGIKIILPPGGTIPNTQGQIANAINADTIDGMHAAELQNYNNLINKPGTFPPTAHTHDDRYYTEGEINTVLGSKANINNPTFAGIARTTSNINYTTSQLRNIVFGTTELVPGSSQLESGTIYIQYE